ncbi:MAG: exo-alpha-sialidase [Verrucomicrobiota bacterium]
MNFAKLMMALLLGMSAYAAEPELLEVRRIWDRAPHNAFTDLLHHKGEWFCVFREGKAHVSPDGALRVIVSKDGTRWESAALITSPNADLRDAKIGVTADGRLMLNGAAALHDQSKARHQSMVWFSKDGRQWDTGQNIGDPDFWLWRATWHEGRAYTIGYNTDKERAKRTIRLYRSDDGARFETVVPDLGIKNSPGENTLRFLKDGTCVCFLRRDVAPFSAQLGMAKPPYREWQWKDLAVRVGGPNFIELPDGRFVAASRLHDGTVRTSLSWLDIKAGTLQEFLKLPSGGDSSYAGLVWHEGLLWVSYYSSHEGKAAIYLAKIRIP